MLIVGQKQNNGHDFYHRSQWPRGMRWNHRKNPIEIRGNKKAQKFEAKK